MDEFFKKVINNSDEPYSQVLDDMGIISQDTRKEFIESTILFANNCNKIANENNYPINQQMDGYFHWRTFSPATFFKIHFSYYHSQELFFAIRGFETLSMEDNNEENIKIFNESSDLVKNIINKNLN